MAAQTFQSVVTFVDGKAHYVRVENGIVNNGHKQVDERVREPYEVAVCGALLQFADGCMTDLRERIESWLILKRKWLLEGEDLDASVSGRSIIRLVDIDDVDEFEAVVEFFNYKHLGECSVCREDVRLKAAIMSGNRKVHNLRLFPTKSWAILDTQTDAYFLFLLFLRERICRFEITNII